MIPELKKKDWEKQGYRLVGNHSAIKVCLWTKKCIRSEDACYKSTFYGIKSHRCVQMTPSFVCSHRCAFCWRDIDFTPEKWDFPVDEPAAIIDGCIEEHRRYLHGFGGNPQTDKKRYKEAMKPLHFAISLAGEPTFYPRLPELIRELKKRHLTSFVVTNGTNTAMLKKLLEKNSQPTQLYITLPAPDEETYKGVCNPLLKDGWNKLQQSLKLLKEFKRSTLRLTLAKGLNMIRAEKYAKLIQRTLPKFVELKAYMWVGFSRQRLQIENMPLHKEIVGFAEKIEEHSHYRIIDEKKESRVVLMMKRDLKNRVMEF
jgi:tRNA wybutosine-synthesizing protein 1